MNPTVLIVDDEVTFLESAKRKLRMAGYTAVTTVADPREALALFDAGTFEVAFLDITMPGMTGLELLEHILERSPATRCVMVTALDNIESVMKVYREANIHSGRAWEEMLHKMHHFTDLILLTLLETYHKLESVNH